MTTPESTEKLPLHDVVKCGWICTACRVADRFREKVEQSPCSCLRGGHAMIEKAVMCKNCDQISDDMTVFRKQQCRGTGTPPSHAKTVSSRSESESEEYEMKVRLDIRFAEEEVRRLRALKMLEEERAKLQQLLARKASSTSFSTIFFYNTRKHAACLSMFVFSGNLMGCVLMCSSILCWGMDAFDTLPMCPDEFNLRADLAKARSILIAICMQ